MEDFMMVRKPTREELEQKIRELENEVFDLKQAEKTPAKLNPELERGVEDRTDEVAKTNGQLIGTRTLLDNVLRYSGGDVVMATDMDMRILLYNQRAKEAFGYGEKEVLGKSVFEMHMKEKVESERLEQAIRMLSEKGVYEYDHHVKDLEGSDRWFHSIVTPLKNEKGEQLGYVLNSRDVTKQKRTEQRLFKSEKGYRDLFDSITDLIFTQDLDGRFITVNHAMSALFGYEKDEFIGRPASVFYEAGNECFF